MKTVRLGGLIAVALVAGLLTPTPAAATNEEPATGSPRRAGPLRPDQPAHTRAPLPVTSLLVRYRKDVAPQQSDGTVVGQSRTSVQLTDVTGTGVDRWSRVALAQPLGQTKADLVAAKLQADPRILSAEPNLRFTHTAGVAPDDPLFALQWDLLAPLATDAGPLDEPESFGVQMPQAWAITQGGINPPVVAVLDTGSTSHPDLGSVSTPGLPNQRWVSGYDFISYDDWFGAHPYPANDGDGRDADPADPGDWISSAEDDGDEDDGFFEGCGEGSSSWHGTHVTGTIGATWDNAVGISGMLASARIQPIRVLGKCGGYTDDIAAAITWASGGAVAGVPDNPTPAKVLNLSLGFASSPPESCPTVLQDSITGARDRGSTVVVAAGNSDLPASNPLANCDGVVAVAATSQMGDRAAYSNYGSNVDLAAPGGDFVVDDGIVSTLNDGRTAAENPTYAAYQGTSMAAPHVAGAAALYLALNPTKSPAEVEAALKASAYPFPYSQGYTYSCRGADGSCGAGILNVAKLLGGASSAERPATVRNLVVTSADSAIEVRFDPPSTGEATSYLVSAYDESSDTETSTTVTGTSARVDGLTNGLDYYVSVRAGNARGYGASWWFDGPIQPTPTPSVPTPTAPPIETPTLPPTPTPSATPTATPQRSGQSVKPPPKTLKRKKRKAMPALSSAGLRVTWQAKPRKICKTKNGRLVALRRGRCQVTAYVAADPRWLPLTKTFLVKIK
jgi:serine protease